MLELQLRERAAVESFTMHLHWKLDELREYVNRRIAYVLGSGVRWEQLFDFLVQTRIPSSRRSRTASATWCGTPRSSLENS